MVISGTDSLEVPTVYKAYDSYVSGLFFREYPHKISPYMVQYGTNVAPFEDPEDLPLIYPIPSKSLCQGGTKSRSPRTRVIPRWQEAPRLFRIVFFGDLLDHFGSMKLDLFSDILGWNNWILRWLSWWLDVNFQRKLELTAKDAFWDARNWAKWPNVNIS